jgi:hypothetical protein
MIFSILFLIYIYAIIGIMLFNTNTNPYRINSPYAMDQYADFNSFASALLCLFEICTENGWIIMMEDIGYKFSYVDSVIFFCSFHMLLILFLVSLLKGLIWDVFNVVDEMVKQ